MLDEYALALLLVNNSLLVPWYLMCGHLYEHKNTSVISDFLWDQICEKLLEQFNSIEHHHKYLIDPSALCTATFHHIREESIPLRIKNAAMCLVDTASKIKDA